jgi:hypothetical protein
MPPARKPLAERFWPKVNKNGPVPKDHPELGPCWIWTRAVNPQSGYGQIGAGGHDGQMLLAHRVAYELVTAAIPANTTIDHLCVRRTCVNPSHLEPCSTQVNSHRGAERRLTCHRGHPSAVYAYINPKTGYRRCRACNTENARDYRQRIRDRASAGGNASLPDALPGASSPVQ